MGFRFLFGIITANLLLQGSCAPNSYVANMPVFEFFKSLDINSMARLLAYKNRFMKPKRNTRPQLVGEWEYNKINKKWPERLAVYGYGIADIQARGDGSCMFNTLSIIFRTEGITKEKIRQNIDKTMPQGIHNGIMAITSKGDFLEPIELKRISIISFFGCDPDVPESYAHYNHDHLLQEIGKIAESEWYANEEAMKLLGNSRAPITEGWDVKKTYDELRTGTNQREAALALFRTLEKALQDRWGDYLDLNLLERYLGFKGITFGHENTVIGCGEIQRDLNPKFFVTIYYFKECHFDVAGLFNLDEQAPVKPKSLFRPEEIPVALAILMTDDCKL
ncbi:signal peptide-containing protein [Theileria equi strain WA]|uniref:Signal peptide-containing protein n=1 Tax=Theileria equi strain WA TaxID=1537102 RepID=L0B1Z3_THEEQ|nr:signal peptide-containing protein [Theileria equi strain WA]AFZ81266.1 signal peptide-containing protein [Theileria equi strain WA]|eukprot:XP_004830932.1 signal peptide-containing protein [Theileria equi strain WA]